MSVNPKSSTTSPSSPPLLEAALRYLDLGLPVIPLQARSKIPTIEWKTFQDRLPTEDEVCSWFANPDLNVGLVTGRGFFVVDIDSDQGRQEVVSRGIPNGTLIAQSGKGHHLYFALPAGLDIRGKTGFLAGVDLRGKGSYIVAPPSIHENGRQYVWLCGKDYKDTSPLIDRKAFRLVDPPDWIINLYSEMYPGPKPAEPVQPVNYQGIHPHAAKALEEETAILASKPEHQRNDQLNRSAFNMGQLVAAGEIDRSTVTAQLAAAALQAGLEPGEIERSIESGLKSGIAKPRTAERLGRTNGRQAPTKGQETPAIEADYHLTDLGNAERFVAQFGPNLRYLAERTAWLCWTGIYWEPDKTFAVYRAAQETIKGLYRAAADQDDKNTRQTLAKHALISEARSRIESMIALARTLAGVTITADTLDQNAWLIGCQNGTIDLKTGQLREPVREDLITQVLPVDYDPDQDCPTWLRFLNRVLDGNQALIDFVQRAIGYTLTGDTSEQCLFFLHGRGKNGKTTFVEVLSALMGDYGLKTSTETFMSKKQAGIPNDIAALAGKRFVFAAETEEGRRLNEVLIKELTGGDTINARFLHQEFFNFKPVHKLWMAGNHKPVIRGTDDGIWRRLRMLPFNVQIPEEERDPQLLAKLTAELPGILAWAVIGCLKFSEEGLNPPEDVVIATTAYRAEMNVFGAWIEDCCVVLPTCVTPAKTLYDSYTAWCTANNEPIYSQRRFSAALAEQGCEPKKGTAGMRLWRGIGILSGASGADDTSGASGAQSAEPEKQA